MQHEVQDNVAPRDHSPAPNGRPRVDDERDNEQRDKDDGRGDQQSEEAPAAPPEEAPAHKKPGWQNGDGNELPEVERSTNEVEACFHEPSVTLLS